MLKQLLFGSASVASAFLFAGAAQAGALLDTPVGGFDATGLVAEFETNSITFEDGTITNTQNGVFAPFLNGDLMVSPLTFSGAGATAVNPVVQDGFSFVANSVVDPDGLKNNTFGVAFYEGTFLLPGGVEYFGTLAISANNVGAQQSYSLSAEAFEVVPEPLTILGTGFVLSSLPALKKAAKKKAK